MAKKNLPKKDEPTTTNIQLVKITTESIDYDLDSDLETNGDLIKYEFNMIELPFFSKDKKVNDGVAKQYVFSGKKNQYMKVIPSGDPDLISNKIPQEFDEKIFYGILKLSKEQNSDVVITDYFTLAKVAGVPYKNKERIEDSIQRLRRCVFELNNLFYSSEESGISREKKDFNILQDLEIYDLDRVMNLKDVAKKELYQKYFRNSKIDNILVLTLSKRIYANITNKAFLYFNQQDLLNIDNATARKLYILISKWQGWEKKNQIRRSCRFIASRLPLSWEKASITGTIYSIDSAAALLKDKGLISDYFLTKTKPIADSFIDFYFGNEKNRVLEYNRRAASITTGQENIVIDSVDDFLNEKQSTIFDIAAAAADVENLLREVPEAERTDSVKKLLEKFASKGSDYIKSNILYTNANCPENYPGYLARALAEDFAAVEREKAELKAKQEQEKKEREAAAAAAEKARKEELQRRAAEKYENMSEEEKVALHKELRRKPFFDMLLNSLGGDISKAAIFQIAFDLEKES